MSTNAAFAPASSKSVVWHAIAGGAAGVFVGIAWWMLARMTLLPMGAAVPFLVAPVLGAAVGLLAVLMAGGKSRGALIVSAAVALVGMYLADTLLWGPVTPLKLLADLVTRPGVAFPYVLRVLPLAAISAVAAAAVTIWDPLAMLRSTSIPRVRAPRIRPDVPVRAPEPAVVAAPVVEPEPVTAAPVVPEAPPAPLEAAPAAPVPAPARAPREPFDLAGFAKRNRVLLIAGAAGVLVLAIGLGAFTLGMLVSGGDSREADSTPTKTELPPESEPDDGEPAPAAGELDPGMLPEEVVAAMYEAAANGDEERVSAAMDVGFFFDPGTLEAWGNPQYSVQTVTAGSQPGEILVEVYEPGGGFSDWDSVTWMLREEPQGWRVNGWMLGTIEDNLDLIMGETPAAQAGEQDATDILLDFLMARMGGDVNRMGTFATSRMRQAQPDLFVPETKLASVNIVDLQLEGSAYRAFVEETWTWGLEVHTYMVVPDGDSWLVDEWE
jgi:hypothetical protein